MKVQSREEDLNTYTDLQSQQVDKIGFFCGRMCKLLVVTTGNLLVLGGIYTFLGGGTYGVCHLFSNKLSADCDLYQEKINEIDTSALTPISSNAPYEPERIRLEGLKHYRAMHLNCGISSRAYCYIFGIIGSVVVALTCTTVAAATIAQYEGKLFGRDWDKEDEYGEGFEERDDYVECVSETLRPIYQAGKGIGRFAAKRYYDTRDGIARLGSLFSSYWSSPSTGDADAVENGEVSVEIYSDDE